MSQEEREPESPKDYDLMLDHALTWPDSHCVLIGISYNRHLPIAAEWKLVFYSSMAFERYLNRYGKLVFSLSIPVDEKMKLISDRSKSAGIDFNAWARDVLAEKIGELEAALNSNAPKDAA